jgi:hypothetical protein
LKLTGFSVTGIFSLKDVPQPLHFILASFFSITLPCFPSLASYPMQESSSNSNHFSARRKMSAQLSILTGFAPDFEPRTDVTNKTPVMEGNF